MSLSMVYYRRLDVSGVTSGPPGSHAGLRRTVVLFSFMGRCALSFFLTETKVCVILQKGNTRLPAPIMLPQILAPVNREK